MDGLKDDAILIYDRERIIDCKIKMILKTKKELFEKKVRFF